MAKYIFNLTLIPSRRRVKAAGAWQKNLKAVVRYLVFSLREGDKLSQVF